MSLSGSGNMDLVLLGTGGPVSDGKRAASCTLVTGPEGHLLFDCGPGAGLRLGEVGLPAAKLDAIVLSHLHMDHCLELPSIVFGAFLQGRKDPMPVFGPVGTRALGENLFDRCFPYLSGLVKNVTKNDLRVEYHEYSESRLPVPGKLEVTSAPVSHGNVSAYGFRVSNGQNSAAISGDSEPCEALVQLADSVDALVQDCAFPDSVGRVLGHTLPAGVGELAARARPRRVILTHLFPACNGHESEMLESVRKSFRGDVVIPRDLQRFSL